MNTPTQPQLTRAANIALKPEWLHVSAAVAYSGIGRSSIYDLIEENAIRSAVVKKRGNTSGRRLISVASLDDYLNRLADSNAPAEVTTAVNHKPVVCP